MKRDRPPEQRDRRLRPHPTQVKAVTGRSWRSDAAATVSWIQLARRGRIPYPTLPGRLVRQGCHSRTRSTVLVPGCHLDDASE